MKVFLVSLILLILVAALFFMVSSQESIAPIVYLSHPFSDETYPPDFNFQVMDVNTGEVIFEAATEVQECPFRLSPDKRWLIYRFGTEYNDMDYGIVHLETGHQIAPDFSQATYFLWFPDSSGFVFHNIGSDEYNYSIYQYTPATEMLEHITTLDWLPRLYNAGNSFIYVHHEFEENHMSIYQADGQSRSFEFSYDEFSPLDFSNDGRFLLYRSQWDDYDRAPLYLLDTTNGDTQELVDAQYPLLYTWHPQTNQLLYGAKNDYLTLLNPVTGETLRLQSSISVTQPIGGIWSPDGNYLVVNRRDGGTETIFVFDFSAGSLHEIDSFYNNFSEDAGILDWTSPTEFAYIHTDGASRSSEENSSDIFLYNVETQTSRNLTNTPDILEYRGCFWG